MTLKDIEELGWKHDYNDDGEEYPNEQDKHGYSMGFNIDTQLINDTAYIMYYFPDSYCIIDKIYKCSSSPDHIFEDYIKDKIELKILMVLMTKLGI
jgi:hypothetical protein